MGWGGLVHAGAGSGGQGGEEESSWSVEEGEREKCRERRGGMEGWM